MAAQLKTLLALLLFIIFFHANLVSGLSLATKANFAECRSNAFTAAYQATKDCGAQNNVQYLSGDNFVVAMQGNMTALKSAAANGNATAFEAYLAEARLNMNSLNGIVNVTLYGFTFGAASSVKSAIECRQLKMQEINSTLFACEQSALQKEKVETTSYYSESLASLGMLSTKDARFSVPSWELDAKIAELRAISGRISSAADEGNASALYMARAEFSRKGIYAYLADARASSVFLRSHYSLLDNDNGAEVYSMADLIINYSESTAMLCPDKQVTMKTDLSMYALENRGCWERLNELSRLIKNMQFIYSAGRPEESVFLHYVGLLVAKGEGKAAISYEGRLDVAFMEEGHIAPVGNISITFVNSSSLGGLNLYGSGELVSQDAQLRVYKNVTQFSLTTEQPVLISATGSDMVITLSGNGKVTFTGEGKYKILRNSTGLNIGLVSTYSPDYPT